MQRENQPPDAQMERIKTGENRTPADVDTGNDARPAGSRTIESDQEQQGNRDGKRERPDMTTPSRMTETTHEMDQDPALADALRERIAGREFTEAIRSMQDSNTETLARQAQLGETVREAIRAVNGNVREMAAAAERMRSDIGQQGDRAERTERTERTELQTQEIQEKTQEQLGTLRGAVDNAAGPGYEMKAASNLRSLLRQRLGLRNARILKGPNREPDEELTATLDQAQENGLITEEELGAVLLQGAIARANTTDRQTVYAAVEISITVRGDDVARAQERARTISKATGTPSAAVVIGANTGERAAAMIADGKAQMVRYPAG